MPNTNRRDFLKKAALLTTGTFLLPHCTSNTEQKTPSAIKFEGTIRGEKHSFGHRLRDKKMTIDKPIISSEIYDVVIAGGGMCGLTTAHKLHKEGITKVLLLEKEDKVGGLCRGEEHEGIPYACGAHYTDYPEPHMQAVNEVFEDCGIITSYQTDGWPVIPSEYLLHDHKHQIYANEEWVPYDFPYQMADATDEDEMHRFEELMLELSSKTDKEGKYFFGLPLGSLSTSNEMKAYDAMSMKKFLVQNQFNSELLHWYCNIWIIDEFGVGIDECSAWAGIQFFRHKIKPEGKSTPTVTFAKGLGFITEKLQNLLPTNCIRTGQWVVRVEQKDGLVLTTIWDEAEQKMYKVKSKKAVFSLPKQQVYYLIPELRAAKRTEFENLPYAPWIVANVHLSRLPDYDEAEIMWDNTIYDSWTMGYVDNQHQMKNKPTPDQAHIISMYACFSKDQKTKRALMENLGWEHWARIFLDELEKAHPEIANLITKMDFWFWGHPMRQPVVGSVWGEQRKKMNVPFGNIHFGHVDVCGIPIAEEAIDLGVRLAKQLKKEIEKL